MVASSTSFGIEKTEGLIRPNETAGDLDCGSRLPRARWASDTDDDEAACPLDWLDVEDWHRRPTAVRADARSPRGPLRPGCLGACERRSKFPACRATVALFWTWRGTASGSR